MSVPTAQARKRAQRLTSCVRKLPGGVGVFHTQGVGVEKLVPSPESLFFLGFRRRKPGISREFCRDVQTPTGVQKVNAQKKVLMFRSLSAPEKLQDGKSVLGNYSKSCNAFHDRITGEIISLIFVLHSTFFGQNRSCKKALHDLKEVIEMILLMQWAT